MTHFYVRGVGCSTLSDVLVYAFAAVEFGPYEACCHVVVEMSLLIRIYSKLLF